MHFPQQSFECPSAEERTNMNSFGWVVFSKKTVIWLANVIVFLTADINYAKQLKNKDVFAPMKVVIIII